MGPQRLATLRLRLHGAGVPVARAILVLDALEVLLTARGVAGAASHCIRPFQILELIVSAAEASMKAAAASTSTAPTASTSDTASTTSTTCVASSDAFGEAGGAAVAGVGKKAISSADTLLVDTLRFSGALSSEGWTARLGRSVPLPFRHRLSRALQALCSHLPPPAAPSARPLTSDDLWALAVSAAADGAPAPSGFVVAQLVARSSDPIMQFQLHHIVNARVGRVLYDLLHAGRDVVPVRSAASSDELEGGGVTGVAVYDRPTARQQLERVCAPVLAELSELARGSDAPARIELQWTPISPATACEATEPRPRPRPPPHSDVMRVGAAGGDGGAENAAQATSQPDATATVAEELAEEPRLPQRATTV